MSGAETGVGGGGSWMTGGGSVVMATHRSATATRNRVEPRPHHTLPAATNRAATLPIDTRVHSPTPSDTKSTHTVRNRRGHTDVVSHHILRATRP